GSTVNVTVKNGITTSPTPVLTATFTSPASGATVKGSTTVGMSVTGSTAVSKTFQLAVDGTVVSTKPVSGSTTSHAWNTTGVANGSHTLSLTVTDTANGSATTTRNVTVSNTVTSPAPTGSLQVSVTQPAGGGATVSGTQWVTIWVDGAAAGNNTYTLTANGRTVWTEANGDRPATLPWNTASGANGAATLPVSVKDSAGKTGSRSISVWVAN